MKKILLLHLLVCCLCRLNAQISIGPTIGFGHSWVDHINKYSYGKYNRKFDPAWNAGLSFIYNTKKHFGLGVDVNYSVEGDKAYTPGTPLSGDINAEAGTPIYHFNYIRIPLKFIYCFGKYNSFIRPEIYAGPSFGFLLNTQSIFKTDAGIKFKSNNDYPLKNFDFGATAAVGVNIRVNKKFTLRTDIQYYQGLTNITSDYSPAYHITDYNGNIELNVALLIKL